MLLLLNDKDLDLGWVGWKLPPKPGFISPSLSIHQDVDDADPVVGVAPADALPQELLRGTCFKRKTWICTRQDFHSDFRPCLAAELHF